MGMANAPKQVALVGLKLLFLLKRPGLTTFCLDLGYDYC
jgi:hypothetical protein